MESEGPTVLYAGTLGVYPVEIEDIEEGAE